MPESEGELLPPGSSDEVAQPFTINSAASAKVNPWKIALALVGGGLSSLAIFALSEYLQARGIVSVPLARIFLTIACLAFSALVWIITKAFKSPPHFGVIGIAGLIATLGGLEVWASSRGSEALLALTCDVIALPVIYHRDIWDLETSFGPGGFGHFGITSRTRTGFGLHPNRRVSAIDAK